METRRDAAARGFTLIELMVVIVILGMLVALVVPYLWRSQEESANKAALAQVSHLSAAVQLFLYEKRILPTGFDELTRPAGRSNLPFLERVPKDPWGGEYEYRVVDAARKRFEIRSGGGDRVPGTDDDLVWPDDVDA